MQFNFDDREFRELSNKLHRFARRGVPYAARNALNTAAFTARKDWQGEIEDTFVLRNKWTTRGIRVKKARGRDLARMSSRVGSAEQYMRDQEGGATIRKPGSHGVPIPTSVASGEGRGKQPRKKVVRRPHRMRNIQLQNRVGTSRKQRNAIAIRRAKAAGKKFVWLDLERNKGIFRLYGGKRRTRLEMIYEVDRPSVRIPPTRTLRKTLRAMRAKFPEIHKDAIRDQLRRNRVAHF